MEGNKLTEDIYRSLTDCPDANCTFSRTVAPVPVPAAVWFLGCTLLGLAGVARRN
ncbi:MAG: VPLPA-CTERM sorting domain-containing protein [Gammaproteobacteria bacterium]|nr:VPLPA-CTERM sorting domain-containing protein [Gammaproteobacteria bacterium]